MNEPNHIYRRPTTGSQKITQSVRNTNTGKRDSDRLFEVRVGEPWSRKAKSMLDSKLGLTQIVHGSTYQKTAKAKVLVFTGHHWVNNGGNPGEFRPMDRNGNRIRTRGIDLSKVMQTRIAGMRLELVSYNAKLIIVSGCYSLYKRSSKWLHVTFPNAALLGFFGSSPR